MEDIVIVSAVRTPVGRFGGTLRDYPPAELAALVLKEAVKRAKIEPTDIDDVIIAHTVVSGETPAAARQAVLEAGFPVEVTARGVERQCGSGLQAIADAVMQIQTGNARIIVAGGVECMSSIEYYVTGARWGLRMGPATFYDRWPRSAETLSTYRFGKINGMIHTAENVAEKLSISREAQDEFALLSQQRAAAAIAAGKYKEEIVPVPVPQRKGPPIMFDTDEHPRTDTTRESLAALKPVQGATVTAGNASGMNDGAAACVLMSETTAKELGLEPMGYFKGWSVAGVHPGYMGLGPVEAVRKVLAKTGLTWADMDLIELNEAFAAQALGCLQELNVTDWSNVNVNGSGIALGHPIACTGARIMVSLLHEMKRRNARYGLETMCIGGGQGIAAIVERK